MTQQTEAWRWFPPPEDFDTPKEEAIFFRRRAIALLEALYYLDELHSAPCDTMEDELYVWFCDFCDNEHEARHPRATQEATRAQKARTTPTG